MNASAPCSAWRPVWHFHDRARTGRRGQINGMRGRKLAQQLFGIESNFTRDRANDRAAVDAFGQCGHPAAFERFDRAHR